MMYRLLLSPDSAGYSMQDGEDTIRQTLSGGPGRYRADLIGAPKMVNCQWNLSQGDYNYIRAFYNHHARQAKAFSVDLIIDTAEPATHEARFMPGGLKLLSVKGLMYSVGCTLEVTPEDNANLDAAVLDLVSEEVDYDLLSALLRRLEVFVVTDLDTYNV